MLELNDDSLDIFINKGYHTGDWGGNVYFLGNRDSDYKPIANLFDKVVKKLKDDGRIMSDGALVKIPQLREVYDKAYMDRTFSPVSLEVQVGDVKLICEKRHGDFLVWRLKKNIR